MDTPKSLPAIARTDTLKSSFSSIMSTAASLFSGPSLTVYRLTRRRFASLSGLGSSLVPGRWNLHGQEAIYTSLERAGTILELLVHTSKDLIPRDMALMEIEIRGEWFLKDPALQDTVHGGRFMICSTTAEATAYLASGARLEQRAFALAIPSVLAPIWNVVLYPAHEGFVEHVKLKSVQSFEFDPRLFPEGAVIEDAL